MMLLGFGCCANKLHSNEKKKRKTYLHFVDCLPPEWEFLNNFHLNHSQAIDLLWLTVESQPRWKCSHRWAARFNIFSFVCYIPQHFFLPTINILISYFYMMLQLNASSIHTLYLSRSSAAAYEEMSMEKDASYLH